MSRPDPFAYPAALYAAVHRGNAGDVSFYLSACRGAATVLELGCGSGRVGAALSAAGCVVVGLDRNLDALRMAARAGLMCVAADMRDFAFNAVFERVIIPYNGLYCLLEETDVVRCLRNAGRHLAAGGQLIFDLYMADALYEERHRKPWSSSERVATFELEGRGWEVIEDSLCDPRTRRVDATYRHLACDGGTVVTATIAQRYLFSDEIPDLLARAGLHLVALNGGFAGERFDADSEHLVVRAARV